MLTPPHLSDDQIFACLREAYGLHITQSDFLPLGADVNTAVYRVIARDGTPYFLKLRRGEFDETTVTVPAHLHHVQGIASVMAALPTTDRRLLRFSSYSRHPRWSFKRPGLSHLLSECWT